MHTYNRLRTALRTTVFAVVYIYTVVDWSKVTSIFDSKLSSNNNIWAYRCFTMRTN